MFDITPQDIAQLDDVQLRTLVGLLCEAELRASKYSTSAVTYGGDQNAKDGGLDVRVQMPPHQPTTGFIPRGSTGFQVKKQDMPPRSIEGEMRPSGELRPVIRALGKEHGAYIIVSSEGSTADSALTNRKNAMRAASKDAPDLIVDFYDRTRLASWVRNHAGLVVWVRQAIGRSIQGWEPYGAWAYPAGGPNAEYLLENGVAIKIRSAQSDTSLDTKVGIQTIRDALSNPSSVVRLVGLSGVGKTRLAQALFDDRIGDGALDPALAVYTNMNNDPNPQPFALASDLIATNARAALVVDNCPPDLHAQLSSLIRDTNSGLSVLTIEYDIRDDQPEGTDVFEVHAASIELVEKLVRSRFPRVSQVDARTAAELSGGNARIAIALADTVSRGGTLAKLNDTQIFERLFQQRNEQDRSLLEIAQACSLVYSFDGEDVSDNGELARLASLVGATPDSAHSAVAEMMRRDLAQRRGKWRAILPHALANRLAMTALQNIPFAKVEGALSRGAPERLTISLSRRLGYLDTSPEAIKAAGAWLDPKGWIGEYVWNLNEFGKSVFRNILPANAEAGLRCIEVNRPAVEADTPLTTGGYLPRALRLLAWDATLFERCVALLQFIAIHAEGQMVKDAIEVHHSLFHLYLSGTHATIEQRAAVARHLLLSENPKERAIGNGSLDALLESGHFSSSYDFQFGSHSRDYGYYPRKRTELVHWYRTAFAPAKEVAENGSPAAADAVATVGANFRNLWLHVDLRDDLEKFAREQGAKGFWREGWAAVKTTRFYDEKEKGSENYARLSRLEEALRPQDLVQQVRGRVISPSGSHYDLDDIELGDAELYGLAMEKSQKDAVAFGKKVAGEPKVLAELLPEIVTEGGLLWHFGMGLAQGTADQESLWNELVDAFAKAPKDQRDSRVLSGFLLHLNQVKRALVDRILDDALDSDVLGWLFPILQSSVRIDERGVERLFVSLEIGTARVGMYSSIFLGGNGEEVSAKSVAAFLLKLASVDGGESVAIHHLSLLFHGNKHGEKPFDAELVAAGRKVLSELTFDRENRREDYHLNRLIEVCAVGEGGDDVCRAVIEQLKAAIAEHKTYGFYHNGLLNGLFKAQPLATLSALLSGDKASIDVGTHLVDQVSDHHVNPLDKVPEDVLFKWAHEDPGVRYPILADVISIFSREGDAPVAWSPIAVRLVHTATEPSVVFEKLARRLEPMSWSGSRSSILVKHAELLNEFDVRGNATLSVIIRKQKDILVRSAKQDLERETKRDRERNETFE